MTEVRLASVRFACHDVNLYEFTPIHGSLSSCDAPDTYLELELPTGLRRAYYIAELSPYGSLAIGVRRDSDGRGSKYLHDKVRVGARLRVEVFPGAPDVLDAKRSVVVAEDVGIFPALRLARDLTAGARDWRLWYDAWSRDAAPLLESLRGDESRVDVHLRSEHHGDALDMARIAAAIVPGDRVYAFAEPASLDRLSEQLAARGFDVTSRMLRAATAAPRDLGPVEFDVVLARSGISVGVRAHETVLDAVRATGVEVRHFCKAGLCGTCRTTVLEGVPRHRGAVLSESERASNRVMLICQSRSEGPRLVLDL